MISPLIQSLTSLAPVVFPGLSYIGRLGKWLYSKAYPSSIAENLGKYASEANVPLDPRSSALIPTISERVNQVAPYSQAAYDLNNIKNAKPEEIINLLNSINTDKQPKKGLEGFDGKY